MIELDRNTIPALPHPVYAVVFERPDIRTVRICTQASEGHRSWCEEFTVDGATGAAIRSWLMGLDYPLENAETWRVVCDEIAQRAAAWVQSTSEDRGI